MTILTIDWANAFDIVSFGIGMVFILLIMLVIVLTLFSKVIAPKVRVPRQKKATREAVNTKSEPEEYDEDHLSANDSAAIAMALHLYYAEAHDVESAVITIKTVERRYSPWSSKIYGVHFMAK